MVEGASLLASQAVKKAIFKDLLGPCLTNENGEYYTKFNKVSHKTNIITLVSSSIIFLLCFIVSFFTDDAELARFFLLASVIGCAMMILLFFVIKKSISNTWTLKEEGIEVKTNKETKLYPYSLIKESAETWPVIQFRNDVIIMAGNEMIKIPYVNNTGGANFVLKLGEIAGIKVLEPKLMVDTVTGVAKRNRQEEERAFMKRNSLVK